mmetsp:Transcript_24270/g.45151  ORF Transcript_24270/g.45151 Transcript_24270/m.45151 type:complete len:706 (-) Transcript_24270:48-2165(-)
MNIDLNRVFEEADETIRSDILLMIVEHLHREKLSNAANILEDELSSKLGAVNSKRVKVLKFHKALLNGDWDASVKLLSTLVPKSSQRCFLYYILRQQFLELIDNGEQERAFPFLVKHLKPLEDIAVSQGAQGEVSEFKELCYLLTCSAIGEAEGSFFRDWKHYYHQRELLADRLVAALHKYMQEEGGVLSQASLPATSGTTSSTSPSRSRASRLTELLKQGFAYQVEKLHGGESRRHRMSAPSQQHGQRGRLEEKCEGVTGAAASGRLEYPCVRRVLEDYCPAQPPSRARAVLTATRPPLSPSLRDQVAEGLIAAGSCGVEAENIISSIAFTSPSRDIAVINAVGGGNAGVLYGWRYDSSPLTSSFSSSECDMDTPLHRPVWSVNLDQAASRKNSGGGDHSRSRLSTKIRDVCGSSGSGGAGLVAASRSDGSLTVLKSSSHESRVLYPQTMHSAELQGGDDDDDDNDDSNYVRGFEIAGQVNTHDGDAYALALYPSGEYLLSGGFDKHVAVTDVRTLQTLKMFYGHTAAVTQVGCNRSGNLVYSSSRDGTVLFWDMLSGISVRCITPYAASSASAPYSAGRGYSQSLLPASSSAMQTGGGSAGTESSSSAALLPSAGQAGTGGMLPGGGEGVGLSLHSPPPVGGGEITSCSLSEDGKYLLVSSRFLPPKLIDLRTGHVLLKYKSPGEAWRLFIALYLHCSRCCCL